MISCCECECQLDGNEPRYHHHQHHLAFSCWKVSRLLSSYRTIHLHQFTSNTFITTSWWVYIHYNNCYIMLNSDHLLFHTQSSGVGLDDACVEKFQELKLGKSGLSMLFSTTIHGIWCKTRWWCCCCCCCAGYPAYLSICMLE
jgi:hypothetical protein